jgi:hypothetical protein
MSSRSAVTPRGADDDDDFDTEERVANLRKRCWLAALLHVAGRKHEADVELAGVAARLPVDDRWRC